MNYRAEYVIIQTSCKVQAREAILTSSIVFQIGPVVVHWYGLLIVVGTLLGGVVAGREAKRYGENPGHVWFGLESVLVLGFVGARLYHVLSTPATGMGGFRHYYENPIALFQVWDGGLGIYGGIAGGVAAVLLYSRRHSLRAWRWLDIGALGLVLAQAVVRWANFINQELYGPPTPLPWGIEIDAVHRIPRYSDLELYPVGMTRFHPTFFYESLWNLVIFALLLWVGRRWSDRWREGDIFVVYLALFGLGRIWIMQVFRPDAWRLENGLAVGALIGAGLTLGAGVFLLWRHRRRPYRL
jgi:phosphatidylglycerol:prolipoprotein diacylglycerol transferase